MFLSSGASRAIFFEKSVNLSLQENYVMVYSKMKIAGRPLLNDHGTLTIIWSLKYTYVHVFVCFSSVSRFAEFDMHLSTRLA